MTTQSAAARNATATDLVALVISAGVLLPASLSTLRASGIGVGWFWTILSAIVVLQAIVVTSRKWPVPSYAAACLAMLVLALSPHVSTAELPAPAILLPSAVLFFYALFSVAVRCDSRTSLYALGVAIVGGLLVSYRLAIATDWTSQVGAGKAGALVLTAIALVGSLAAWALGRLRSTRIAYLAELEERARRTDADRAREREQAAADERARIAAEMHDVVSHSLAVMVSQAEGGRMVAGDDRTRDVLQTIGNTGRAALTDMRSMLGVLRSDDPTRGKPQAGISAIPDLVEKSGATLHVTGDARTASSATDLAAFRIVQESLTNSLKHGVGAAVVEVTWGNDRLLLTITSPSPGARDSGTGSGIIGMRQRAESVGGTLTAGPAEGRWIVAASLPYNESAEVDK